MDKIDLEELERLHKAATPGPWRVESEVVRDSMGLFWPISSIEGAEDNVTNNITTDDAAYIVAACNAVPELIARVRELERQREFFLKALKENSLCPTRGCFDGSEFDEWDCTAANNRECWIKAAKEAGDETSNR